MPIIPFGIDCSSPLEVVNAILKGFDSSCSCREPEHDFTDDIAAIDGINDDFDVIAVTVGDGT